VQCWAWLLKPSYSFLPLTLYIGLDLNETTPQMDGLDFSECIIPPFYRQYRWGADVEIFVPDERVCRTPDWEVPKLCPAMLLYAPPAKTFHLKSVRAACKINPSGTALEPFPLVPDTIREELIPDAIALVAALGDYLGTPDSRLLT